MNTALIIGPYEGKTWKEQEANILVADEVAKCLRSAGVMSLCPHLNTRYFDSIAFHKNFVDFGRYLIEKGVFDFFVLLPGWEKSPGSKQKKEEVSSLSNPIILDLTNTFLGSTLRLKAEEEAKRREECSVLTLAAQRMPKYISVERLLEQLKKHVENLSLEQLENSLLPSSLLLELAEQSAVLETSAGTALQEMIIGSTQRNSSNVKPERASKT